MTKEFCDKIDSMNGNYDYGADDDMMIMMSMTITFGSPTKAKPDYSDYKYADNAENCDDNENYD